MWGTIVKLARNILNRTGYEIGRAKELPPPAPDIRHAVSFPEATYAPWLSDDEFQRVHQIVRNNTFVDRHRCYELWQLVAESTKVAAGDIIEIGV